MEESPEGGFIELATGYSIFTEADEEIGLKANIKDAMMWHFDEDEMPKLIRLHFVKDEIIAISWKFQETLIGEIYNL